MENKDDECEPEDINDSVDDDSVDDARTLDEFV